MQDSTVRWWHRDADLSRMDVQYLQYAHAYSAGCYGENDRRTRSLLEELRRRGLAPKPLDGTTLEELRTQLVAEFGELPPARIDAEGGFA